MTVAEARTDAGIANHLRPGRLAPQAGWTAALTTALRASPSEPLEDRLAEVLGPWVGAQSVWCGWFGEQADDARWRCAWSRSNSPAHHESIVGQAAAAAVLAGGLAAYRRHDLDVAAAIAPLEPHRYCAVVALGPDAGNVGSLMQIASLVWANEQLRRSQYRSIDLAEYLESVLASLTLGDDPTTPPSQRATERMQRVAETLGGRLVWVTMERRSRRWRVGADSAQPGDTLGGAAFALVEALAEEVRLAGAARHWPAGADVHGGCSSLAARAVAEAVGAPLVAAQPVNNAGGAASVWVLLSQYPSDPRPAALGLQLWCSFWTASQRALGTPRRDSPLALPRPGLRWLMILTLMAALMWPIPYEGAVDAVVEAEVVRTVAAPFDAMLVSSLVEPGRSVEVGELLATLDGQRLQAELASLRAEWERERKRATATQAQGDPASSEIARLEALRIEHRIELLQDRVRRLEIRSPLKGVVIQAHQRGQQGAPLQQGQALFVISPLDQMRAEILLPESDAQQAHVGRELSLTLDANPAQALRARLRALHPQAEVRGRENVFVAEAELLQPPRWLRPGMNGEARLCGAYRPWIWNWIRRPWNKLQAYMTW